MVKPIQPFVTPILSALLMPLFCFALPSFGSTLLINPVTQVAPATCQSPRPDTAVSGLNTTVDPFFYVYPTDPIQPTAPPYCAYNTTPSMPLESTSHTSGTLY